MKYYNLHNLLGISVSENVSKTIIKSIDFQIEYFSVEASDLPTSGYSIEIESYDKFNPKEAHDASIFHSLRGIKERLFIDEGTQFVLEIKPRGYKIYAGSSFLINIFIQLLFVREGYTLIHAAAVADNKGRCLLFPGPGGVGKTAIIGNLVKNHNYKVLGDDLVLLKKSGECYSFPRSFVLKDYHKSTYPNLFSQMEFASNLNKVTSRLIQIFIRNMPFLGLTKYILKKLNFFNTTVAHIPTEKSHVGTVSVKKIFGDQSVIDRAQLEKIIFLERYNGLDFNYTDLKHDSLINRMFSIINHEWVNSMRRIFSLGAMEIISLPEYYTNLNKIIEEGAKNNEAKILQIPKNASAEELCSFIDKII